MSFRRLVAFPLIWGVVFLVLSAFLSGTEVHGVFLRTEITLVKLLAAAGGFAAAFAHRRGEHLRRAWLLLGSSTCFFLLRDLTLAPLGFESWGERSLLILRAVLVVLGNLASVAGIFLLARTWRIAGLTLPGRSGRKAAVVLAAVVVALALAGPTVLRYGARLLSGDLAVTAYVASSLGDMVTLILIAPLLLTALALRGGTFAQPWALLTLSCLAWLGYDAFAVLGPALGLGSAATLTATELCRALGCTWSGAAGLAQRRIALGPKQERR